MRKFTEEEVEHFQKFIEKRLRNFNNSDDDTSSELEDDIPEDEEGEEEEQENNKKKQLQLKNISSEIIQKMLEKREENAFKTKFSRMNNPEESNTEKNKDHPEQTII